MTGLNSRPIGPPNRGCETDWTYMRDNPKTSVQSLTKYEYVHFRGKQCDTVTCHRGPRVVVASGWRNWCMQTTVIASVLGM